LGWITLGGSVVLAGVSTVFAVQFFQANDTNNRQLTKSTHDDAIAAATRLDFALAGTAIAAGAGLVLLLTAPSSPSRTASLSLTPAGLTLRARF
jgi:hypothetical protein